MLVHLLAWLLVRANAQPPHGHRSAFYRMKDAVLQRFGHLVGTEWQHIRKVCYNCGGDGEADDGGSCWRCNGSGNYLERWVLLQRWQLGTAIFHRPTYQTSVAPNEPPTIEGYIRHTGYGADSTEAVLWLALLFDRSLFWDLLRGHYRLDWSWRRPLSLLHRGRNRLHAARLWIRRTVREPLQLRRCDQCGHRFLRAFSPSWSSCPACAHVHAIQREADELPF